MLRFILVAFLICGSLLAEDRSDPISSISLRGAVSSDDLLLLRTDAGVSLGEGQLLLLGSGVTQDSVDDRLSDFTVGMSFQIEPLLTFWVSSDFVLIPQSFKALSASVGVSYDLKEVFGSGQSSILTFQYTPKGYFGGDPTRPRSGFLAGQHRWVLDWLQTISSVASVGLNLQYYAYSSDSIRVDPQLDNAIDYESSSIEYAIDIRFSWSVDDRWLTQVSTSYSKITSVSGGIVGGQLGLFRLLGTDWLVGALFGLSGQSSGTQTTSGLDVTYVWD